jgi:hypothetical protein
LSFERRCAIKNKVDRLRKQIFQLRKSLAALEDKRGKINPHEEPELWQEFVDLSVALDQAEQSLLQINRETASEINHLRAQIIETLDKYNHWRKQMREMEISFLTNIVRPGYVLKQAIRQKAYLEKEYARMRTGIVDGEYESIQALEADIRRTLTHGDHAFEADERSFRDEHRQEKSLVELAQEINAQDFVEDMYEVQIIQNFKRIVLPAIHPDTSDTNPETFLTVFEAYASEDFLLMEAYVAQYQGDIDIDNQDDPVKVQDRLSEYQRDYHRLVSRIDRKLQSLQKDLTKEELEDPEKLQKHLIKQREQLSQLIRDETLIVFDLREKIEGLIQFYIDIKRSAANGL